MTDLCFFLFLAYVIISSCVINFRSLVVLTLFD
jgi:hypothetical protein